MPLELFLLLGFSFGLIASVMAFLIFCEKYQKHRLIGWRRWNAAGPPHSFFLILSGTGSLILSISNGPRWGIALVGTGAQSGEMVTDLT